MAITMGLHSRRKSTKISARKLRKKRRKKVVSLDPLFSNPWSESEAKEEGIRRKKKKSSREDGPLLPVQSMASSAAGLNFDRKAAVFF